MRNLLKSLSLAAVGAALIAVPQAKADLVPVLDSVSGNTYTYNLNFTTATGPQEILDATTGYATIYDIPGYVSGSAMVVSGDFTVTEQTPGITPAGTLPTDTTLINITATYNGASLMMDAVPTGVISFDSTGSGLVQGQFTSEDTKGTGSDAGTLIGHIGNVDVPGGAATPEPATFGLLGAALLGLGALKLRRA